MSSLKLIFITLIMTSLLAIPCTASFARDATLSKSNTATVQVVKKEEVKKERGFFEKILDGIKSVVNFFVTDKRPVDQPATTDQRKTAEPLQQSAVPLATAAIETPAQLEIVEGQERAAEPVDIPQVQKQVQIQQPQIAPPASPGAARATPTPVITVTQNPSVIIPQQVERKDDVLGFSKIEVEPEKNIPEVVDDRKPVVAPTEPAKQPISLSAPAVAPSATARAPSDQETAAPVASDTREPAAKIEQVAPKTVAIIQTPLARTPSESVTTTTATGTRTTATTTATATTTGGARTTATTAPIEPTAITRVPPAEAQRETPSATEPDTRLTSHTETFEGQTIISMTVAPVGTFAIVDTVDNITTNIRTFVVSLSGEGRAECPESPAATATRPTGTQTTTETTRTGVQQTAPASTLRTGETLSAPASIPTGSTLLQRAAPAPQTLAAASTITDAASTIGQAQVISDALKTEMLVQCPKTQRLPTATAEPGSGARFITRTESRTIYVIGNSVRTLAEKSSDEEVLPAGTGADAETTPTAGAEPEEVISPELDVVPTTGDCQATLKATVLCAEVDCTQDYELNAIFKAGNTVMNDFVTKIDASSFLLAPPKEATEQIKGLSTSLNKADIQGPVTITVTAKKGETLFDEEIVDVPNKEDLIARCLQPTTTTEGIFPKAYDETKTDQIPTGHSEMVGGGCSLIRR